MNKTAIELSIVLVGLTILGGLVYYKHTPSEKEPLVTACPTDVMMCSDGSSVPRSGPACEFGVCAQELPQYMAPPTPPVAPTTTGAISTSPTKTVPAPVITTNLFTKISSGATTLFNQIRTTSGKDISSGIKETGSVVSGNNQNAAPVSKPVNTPTQTSSSLNETRYTVEKNKIVDENNTVIYTIPSSSNPSSGWTTHIVDVIPVNNVAPIIGAIPVTGLPGKYYLSENSFGDIGSCQFSNKIYILDTKTGTKVLMYEENSNTLSQDDPRACTSEMYLLATDNEKLILKYHTINTNSQCDSSWSEPEQTWYLDVTKLDLGMKRYMISPELYTQAAREESQCRIQYEATSTPEQVISG